MIKRLALAFSMSVAFAATGAFAQSTDNLEKLAGFKTTGTPMMEPIPQTGANAEAIKENLAKIKLPRRLQDRPLCASFPTPAIWRSARRAS